MSGGAIEVLWDGENPRTFTGVATTAISGGQFVVVTGADCIGSTVSSFNPGSIAVGLIPNSDYANGIALNNAGSEDLVTVATRGAYITISADSISGGALVYPFSGVDSGQQCVKVCPVNLNFSGTPCGRAITAGGSEQFLIVDFNF